MEKRAQQRINLEGVAKMWEWLNRMRSYEYQQFDALDSFLSNTKTKEKNDEQ